MVATTTPSHKPTTQAYAHHWRALLLLLITVQLVEKVLFIDASEPSNAIPRWPALDYKSDRAFYPLMVSFSRYPFHDVYETSPVILAAPKLSQKPTSVPIAGRSGFPKQRKHFYPLGSEQFPRNWRHQGQVRKPTKNVCQGLLYLPQQLEASGRRMLPLKMRKLLKYCGFI
ncbi:uncharacterized protein LOC120896817 [Anopheles arabiensis]|uniref:uncharacterized protein LOC120896817 n=1 Tax=Anopheles arabiensis TaxID=7173 RepID=UPI001AAD7294|nr:uncharacterized protein LOC120896817 [Anopheles arabiensis]XP_061507305.1 uncharacterized protein LOC133392174 [Anopheles gambiae]